MNNNWNVSDSKVAWLERLLRAHRNIISVNRHEDIMFVVHRKEQGDQLRILCCDEYTMGATAVHRALNEFNLLNIIHVGGGWCGYTSEAKHFCLESRIGLYVSDEISGALWRDEYWGYYQTNDDGDKISYSRSA